MLPYGAAVARTDFQQALRGVHVEVASVRRQGADDELRGPGGHGRWQVHGEGGHERLVRRPVAQPLVARSRTQYHRLDAPLQSGQVRRYLWTIVDVQHCSVT